MMSKRFKKMLKNFSFGYFEAQPNIQFNGVPNGPRIAFGGGLNFVEYSEHAPWSCTVIVPYVDKTSLHSSSVDYSAWLNRPLDFFFIGQFDSRRSYTTRRCVNQVFLTNTTLRNQTSFIFARSKNPKQYTGYGHSNLAKMKPCNMAHCYPKCVDCYLDHADYTGLLQRSKFCLIIAGDTVSSSRLYDAISSSCLPVILSDSLLEFGLPFVWRVPWRDFALFLPQEEKSLVDNFLKIKRALGSMRARLEIMNRFKDDVSWSSPTSRVVENIVTETASRCVNKS